MMNREIILGRKKRVWQCSL